MAREKKRLRSGFCGIGSHEGTHPKNWRGNPLPTCTWMRCDCECHEKLDEMFKLAGVERLDRMPNEKYEVWLAENRVHFDMPSDSILLDDTTLSSTGVTDTPPAPENVIGTALDPLAGRAFALTPTGQRARGQLEYEVLAVCRLFANETFVWKYCETKKIAHEIDKNDPPSTGAVTSVLNRWAAMEFAETAKKPIRFVRFLDNDGSNEALDKVKAESKRKRKRFKSDLRRGVRS